MIKVGGKQIKRRLGTKDQQLAKRRLKEFKAKATNLVLEQTQTTFAVAAQRWLDQIASHLKASSHKRRETSVNSLLPFFGNKGVRQIGTADVEHWKKKRAPQLSERSYNMEMDTLRLVLDYCRDDLHLILDHPAERLQKKKTPKTKAVIPTREQFMTLLKEMRSGRSQNKSGDAADLAEFLSYSGCRLSEGTSTRPCDVKIDRDVLLITGGEEGTKNHEQREIPLFPPLKRLLLKLLAERDFASTEPIFGIASAKKAIGNACERAKLPHFTHHHFRHFFCSNAIEAGVDFKTIAEWLGHKDGGVLVAKTYGHLRAEHSKAMAQRITFDASQK